MKTHSKYYFTSFLFLFTISIISLYVLPALGAGGAPIGDIEANYTTQDVIELIAYILLAILFSFLCSIAEATLLNITPSYIADLQAKNPKLAKKVNKVRTEKIDQSLAGILTMNTIAHTVGAIGSGAKATIVFGSAWFGLFSALMTLAILFFSEIIPKTIGVVYWRPLVKPVITYIRVLSFSLTPFIWISEKITHMISKDKDTSAFNRDEFVAMANLGVKEGAFNDRDSKILTNLFQLGSITIKSIFTPRTVMVAFQEDKTIQEVAHKHSEIPFSRLILYRENLDQVTGFVHKNDIFSALVNNNEEIPLKNLKRPITVFPIHATISKVLDTMLKDRQHIALVIDEFGTQGLVTIEDIIETLFGIEIVDESDGAIDMQEYAKKLWQTRMQNLGLDINHIKKVEEEINPKHPAYNGSVAND